MNNANSGKMSSNDMLKAVFMQLEGTNLAVCMGVCKQWVNVDEDDYLWKCLCVKKWPSTYGSLHFSESAPGPALRDGNLTPPTGIIGMVDHLEGPEYKLTLSSEGRATACVQVPEFPIACPFFNFATFNINNEISLLFINRDGILDVFGIEMNFFTAYSDEGVLLL
ncbi:hypothetical protein L2E82_48248 [Cichorium intybus]|uniref:Uncharacterized protein n=1 Tax=Cichorium intybus TaxID=13427 RepID=A0ACB8YWY1_CICIN|nr:hypothetical protein L2E82_48248 [Cichorium intybus]